MIIKTQIKAPIEKVWDEIVDIESHHEWMIDAQSIKPLSQTGQQPFMVGNQYICNTKIGPIEIQDHLTITKIKEPNLLEATHDGLVKGEGQFILLKINDNKTEVVWSESLKFPLKLGGPIGKLFSYPLFKVIWKIDLYQLKKRTESKLKK